MLAPAAILTLLALLAPSVRGHVCLASPAPQFNGTGGDCAPLNNKGSQTCGFPFSMDVEPSEVIEAGTVFNVKFQNPNFDAATADPATSNQARHGGGMCECALSYDGGSNFHVIGRYFRSCPDVFFEWPILFPEDLPSGKALFSWTWIPDLSAIPEYYQDCSVIEIVGGSGTEGSFQDKYCPVITGNLPGRFDNVIDTLGDGSKANTVGRGPIAGQVAMNTEGRTVTCEDGGEFDIDGALNPDDVDGLEQHTTLGNTGEGAQGNGGSADVDDEVPEEEVVVDEEVVEAETPVEEEPAPDATAEPAPEPTPEEAEEDFSPDDLSVQDPGSAPPSSCTLSPYPYCDPSNPTLFFVCSHTGFVQFAPAPGTTCSCNGDQPAEEGVFCEGHVQ